MSLRVHTDSDIPHPHLMAVTAIWGEFIYHDASHTPQMAGYLGMREFVTIRTNHKASMQEITVARLQSKRVQTPLSPLF